MERRWTSDQLNAIEYKDRDILVSAAAGSGKTAVLVERIISMITDPQANVDIDRLVVVTFTKAAAAQMKDKIRRELEKRLDENPTDNNLLRQITLLNNAQITTIDSFCLWIIKNHFPEVNLDPGFRAMDSGEKKLIENDVLEEVLEEMYASGNQEFYDLVDAFGIGKDDSGLVEIINKIYTFARSNPWIDEWFDRCLAVYDDLTSSNPVIVESFDNIKASLIDYKAMYEGLIECCKMAGGPYEYTAAIQSDYTGLKSILEAKDFEELSKKIRLFSFESLSKKSMKEVDVQKKDYVKNKRELYKKYFNALRDKMFSKDMAAMLEDMKGAKRYIKTLVQVTQTFIARVDEYKKEKGLIDFNDMEHLALSILVKKVDGEVVYTETADRLAERFHEILIDEYQDSNQLQEVILNAVSKNRYQDQRNNMYMVGDVKQSIYKFRLACPELFIDKFDRYTKELSDNTRVELKMNFRSRANVLECTNDVFERLMNKDFCGISYDESHRLNPGFPYREFECDENNYGMPELGKTEIALVDSKDEDELNTRQLEGKALAKIIKDIVNSKTMVFDSEAGTYRPVSFRDIVILTRSVTGWADTFADYLMDENIPAYTDVSTGYFSVREIQCVLSLLTIIDNPMQEIPLAATMLSYFGGFNANELGKVRVLGKKNIKAGRHNNLYEHIKIVAELKEEELSGKCALFLERLNQYRQESSLVSVYDLCWEIIYDSGYYDYVGTMPAGGQRQANLNVLLEKALAYGGSSFSGLFNFLRYIERLKKFDEDFAEGAATLENDDVVRIMSIHKSKGLEFPVVILAGTHKKINFMDASGSVLVDQNLGIAVDNIDLNKRTKSTTIVKGAISRSIVRQTIAEEERLLYVAMTRAREKLIITGVVSDLDSKLEKFKENSDTIANTGMFTFADSENIKTYLDMIMPVCMMEDNNLKGKFEIKKLDFNPEDEPLEQRGEALDDELKDTKDLEEERVYSLSEFPEYVPDVNASRKAKITVSELKAMQHDEDFAEGANDIPSLKQAKEVEQEGSSLVPRFMREEAEILASNERGTAYHRVMECLDYTDCESLESVKKDMDNMLETKRMTKLQVESVKVADVYAFVCSDIGLRAKKAFMAGTMRREQPFVFEYDGQLVQGVIDLFFEEDGELVIVDYKTDKVFRGKAGEEELKKRYAIQLNYYADALEQLTGKKVKEKVIYSFTLGKEIFLE